MKKDPVAVKLSVAKNAKNDEFYTQLPDIEIELKNYKQHFKDKVVLCNCDDPFESNFFKYFALNFNSLGLKKLICTCHASSPIIGTQLSLFDVEGITIERKSAKKAYKIEITEIPDMNNDGAVDITDVETLIKSKKNTLRLLKGNGDFQSEECVELLKQSDIVVTNPPFSLFRDFVNLLMKYNKNFIILGNQNALTYKEIFPLLKDNKMWIGYGFNISMIYKTPYPNKLESNRKYVISKGYDPDEGFVKVPAITWFTNLDISKRHEKIILYKHYTPEEYLKYDNYDAINIDKITEIPCDYDGLMGVPITFLDKYNPSQFEIIASSQTGCHPDSMVLKRYSDYYGYTQAREKTGRTGSTMGNNPILEKDDKTHVYYENEEGRRVQSTYCRIFIVRKEEN